MLKFPVRFSSAMALLLVTSALCAEPPLIVVFGDSVSAGYGVPRGKGWVDLLRQRLQQSGSAYQVVNASLSGETTSGGRSRLPGVLSAHRPQILILELGGNDALRGQSLTEARDNLLHMVREAQAAGARVLVIGMRIPPNYGPAYTQKFQALYRDVARQTQAGYVPFLFEGFAEARNMFQADGVHPTDEAQPKMLNNVWPKLAELLSNGDSRTKSRKSKTADR